jgi:hypothetical protein
VTGLRILRHKFHWMKNVGPGDFPATLAMVKDDRTHYNAVVLTLLLMERKKMITSAINVLRGDEELKVDPDRFESGEDVVASLIPPALEFMVTQVVPHAHPASYQCPLRR